MKKNLNDVKLDFYTKKVNKYLLYTASTKNCTLLEWNYLYQIFLPIRTRIQIDTNIRIIQQLNPVSTYNIIYIQKNNIHILYTFQFAMLIT